MERNHRAKVADAGRVLIPAEIRERLGLKTGSEVVITLDERGILISPLEMAIKRAQDFFCSLIPQDVSLSEELVRDRRAEVDRENKEMERGRERQAG